DDDLSPTRHNVYPQSSVRTVDAGALARYHAPRRQDAYLGEAVDNPVRWTVRVSKETDVAVRTFLAQRGMKKGDLAKFVEEAVRWRVLDQTVRRRKLATHRLPGRTSMRLSLRHLPRCALSGSTRAVDESRPRYQYPLQFAYHSGWTF